MKINAKNLTVGSLFTIVYAAPTMTPKPQSLWSGESFAPVRSNFLITVRKMLFFALDHLSMYGSEAV